MTKTQRTVEWEVERRAKAANLAPEAIAEAVREQLVRWAPVRVQYLDLHNDSILAEVEEFPEVGLERVTFNVGHNFVSEMLLSRRVAEKSRDGIEVVLMVIFGVGYPEHFESDEQRRWWQIQQSQFARHLHSAVGVLTEFDKRTGQNLLGESIDDDQCCAICGAFYEDAHAEDCPESEEATAP